MTKKQLASELEVLLSRKSLDRLSSNPKKCYKYALTAIFINLLSGRHFTKGQEDNFQWVYNIKKYPKNFKSQNIYEYLKKTVETSLEAGGYKNPNDFETVNKIFNLFRKIVDQTIKQGTYLAMVSSLDEILDINKVYKGSNYNNIQPHHWINIDINTGMVITVPELLTYSDLISTWNIFVDKDIAYQSIITSEPYVPLIEKINNRDTRRLSYELDALRRTLIISSVTFVESYLYYIFFNFKHSDYDFKTEIAKEFLTKQKVEDEEIINRLILKEFITEPSVELKEILQKYKSINQVRNRLIHASAFGNETSTSDLLPILTITTNQLLETLSTCKRMVELIDDTLPDDFKILVWWDKVIHPDFLNYKKGDITNPDSQLSRIKYMEGY